MNQSRGADGCILAISPEIISFPTALRLLETDAIGDGRGIAASDEHDDQAIQTRLFPKIAKDYGHSILDSANSESGTNERSRTLLELILNRTGATIASPRIIVWVGLVARANDFVLFEWLLSVTFVAHPGPSSAPATRGQW